jgi:tRNA threonylcarbamoyladenosine biosynthesis protein TsaB
MPAIEQILQEKHLTPAGLNGITIGRGPGSYTGVRIGISVAKTMAWALGIPVISVSGLEAMSLGAWRNSTNTRNDAETQWYVPLLDARRKQAFTAIYAFQEGQRRTVATDSIRLVPDWVEQISELVERAPVQPDKVFFIGETAGFQTYIDMLSERYPERVSVRPIGIEAEFVGELGWERWARGEQDDLHSLVPNYTQLAEAEAKLIQKEKQGGDSFG